MFCRKCGAEIDDEAVVCVKCGCAVEQKTTTPAVVDEPKTGMGVVMGLFLGLIGLIIGICLYKEGTIARKTFIKSWLITYLVTIAVIIVFYVVVIASAVSAIGV